VPLALITGASTGIGRATALRLAGAGWTVLAGVRTAEAGEQLRADANGAERLMPLILDVTSAEDLADATRRVRKGGGEPGAESGDVESGGGNSADAGPGRLDALINNAGIGLGGPLEVLSDEDWRRLFDVNLFGQIAVTRALLPALRAARGRIVFISSIGGKVAVGFNGPYAASKHAIEAVGDALRVELRSSGVRVALVEPGSVATPIWDKTRAEVDRVTIPPELADVYGNVPAAMERVLQDTASRGVPPEQVAETIERALSAPRMRSRYPVGRDARIMIIARGLLPDRAFDVIVRRAIGV
jgi:NAD(P)-dependent dehydrogenase (short-subunit alcohol dehydrogenase family)